MRVLGYPLTGLMETGGYQAQYFEKGRLEYQPAELTAPEWTFMYGRLVAALLEHAGSTIISGTSLTYGELGHHQANLRLAPDDFSGGVMATPTGVFVPYDPQLRPAYG